MSSMIGTRPRPFSVSVYSTRGGTSGNVLRSMMPCSSSARSRNDSGRGEMPSSDRSSSQKRERPSARSRIRRIVHLPERISAQAVTEQLSMTSESVVLAPERIEEAAPPPAAERPADAALARLDQHPARALESHLPGLTRRAADQRLHVDVGLERRADAR